MEDGITLARNESAGAVLKAAPAVYKENSASMRRCMEFGQRILDCIKADGMNDNLDEQSAKYIEKSRRTLKAMNEKRSPVTKMFDEIRKEFTAMESAVDPSKKDSLAYQLQQERNSYAAKKRAAEEERVRAELERQKAERARQAYRRDAEEGFRKQFNVFLDEAVGVLMKLDTSVTLDNYEAVRNQILEASETLPGYFMGRLRVEPEVPYQMSGEEAARVIREIKVGLNESFSAQYAYEIAENKKAILDKLPSKKANLERIAKASQEEAARMKALMEQREKEEAARREEERRKAEEEERRKAELSRTQAEMRGLFDEQATISSAPASKVRVSKKITILSPDGILPVLMTWWQGEGCSMSADDLAKMFKRQITYCEKLADKTGEIIKNDGVQYSDEVKAM